MYADDFKDPIAHYKEVTSQATKSNPETMGRFVAKLIWERAYSPKNDAKYISNSHDYVLMYAKFIDQFQIGRLPRTEEANARYTNLLTLVNTDSDSIILDFFSGSATTAHAVMQLNAEDGRQPPLHYGAIAGNNR